MPSLEDELRDIFTKEKSLVKRALEGNNEAINTIVEKIATSRSGPINPQQEKENFEEWLKGQGKDGHTLKSYTGTQKRFLDWYVDQSCVFS